MPTNKDFKRVVRARMKKTGESYTTARAQLVRSTSPSSPGKPARAAAYAELAGMSDASIKKATGCTWERWVKALDYAKADTWTHSEIAAYVRNKFHTPDWWTQTVTVGYERIKGLRVRGQQRDGTYEASKSKVIAAPLAGVFDAFKNPDVRSRWMGDAPLEVRHATKNKSMRIRWADGSAVDVGFVRKGAAKSQVAIGHRKLASKDDVARVKAFWSEKLQALADLIAER